MVSLGSAPVKRITGSFKALDKDANLFSRKRMLMAGVSVCVYMSVLCWWRLCVCVCVQAGVCMCGCVCMRVCVHAHVRAHICAWLFLTGIVRILTLKMVGFFQECWPFFFFFFAEIIYRLPYYPPPSLIFRFSGFDLGVLLVYMNINMWPLWANTYFPFIFLCNVFLTYDNF